MQQRIVILGAAGRDFHNFNVCYREDPWSHVVAFTATQIPDIAGRKYPAELAGMAIVDHAFLTDPPPANDRSFAGLDTPPRLIEKTPIEVTTEDSSEFGNLPSRAQELHRWAMSLHPKLPAAEDAEDCLQELKKAAPGPYPLGDLPLVVVSTGNEAPGYSRLQTQLLALSHRSSQLKAERSFHSVEIDQPEAVVDAIRQVIDMRRH